MTEEPTASHTQFQGKPCAGAAWAQGNLIIGGSKATEKVGTNSSWLCQGSQMHHQLGLNSSWNWDLGSHQVTGISFLEGAFQQVGSHICSTGWWYSSGRQGVRPPAWPRSFKEEIMQVVFVRNQEHWLSSKAGLSHIYWSRIWSTPCFLPPTKGLFLYVIWATPFRIANYVVAFKDELKCSFSLSSIHASINPVATKDIAREKKPQDLLNRKYTIKSFGPKGSSGKQNEEFLFILLLRGFMLTPSTAICRFLPSRALQQTARTDAEGRQRFSSSKEKELPSATQHERFVQMKY